MLTAREFFRTMNHREEEVLLPTRHLSLVISHSLMSEPFLSEEQQIELFHATGRRIASIVTGTRGKRISEQVPAIAAVPLLGAFVSLKRNGELRSCMGTMSDQMPLGDAVEQAAIHASKDDPRFPPLAAAELFELDMEIWLL